MTIQELIHLLSRYPGESEVRVAHPAHDIVDSQIAAPLRGARVECIRPSLSFGHVVVSVERLDSLDEDERAELREVVVLR